jgi:hypothetical protein
VRLYLTREIIYPVNANLCRVLSKDSIGEPIHFHKENGVVTHMDMVFYGQPGIFTKIMVQDLEEV